MNPSDILIWLDGHWCYRAELGEQRAREFTWRVVASGSPEWERLQALPRPAPRAG